MRQSLSRTVKRTINYSDKRAKSARDLNNQLGNNSQQNLKNTQIKMAQAKINIEGIISILPSFDGKKDANIEHFLQLFDQLIEEVQISENLKTIILKAKLTGIAREYIVEDEELSKLKDYKEMKEKLIKIFKKTKSFDHTQSIFMELKQKPAQSIRDYVREFDLAAKKYLAQSGHSEKEGAVDFLNSLKLSKFLDSIRPDLALEIRKTAPKSYEDAVRMGNQIEKAFETIPKESVNATLSKENNIQELLLNMSIKQSEQIKELQEKLERANKNDRIKVPDYQQNKKFCAICNNSSHNTDYCWYNTKSNNYKQQRNNFQKSNNRQHPMLMAPETSGAQNNSYSNNRQQYTNRRGNYGRNNYRNKNNNQQRNQNKDPIVTLPENE